MENIITAFNSSVIQDVSTAAMFVQTQIVNLTDNITSYVSGSASSATGLPNMADADEEILMLKHQLNNTRLVIQRVIVPIVVLIGVGGNVMNITVLTRRWMRSSTNCYLSALAICDIFYLACGFTLSFKHYPSLKEIYYIWSPIGKPFVDIFSNTAVWLTLTFTIERYIGVRFPIKGKVICTTQRARWIIIVVTLSATVVTFPEFFERRTKYDYNEATNRTEAVGIMLTAFATTPSYGVGYVWFTQILFTFLPLILLSLFNFLLIRSVVLSTQRRQSMAKMAVVQNDKQDRYHREQHRITLMLISVVIVFLVCQLPQATLNTSFTFIDNASMKFKLRAMIAANICNLLVQINASVNFILYSFFSTKFRRTFKRVYCKCLQVKDRKNYLFSDVSNPVHATHDQNSMTHLINTQTHNTTYNTANHSPRRSPIYRPPAKKDHMRLTVPDMVDVFVSTV